MTCYSPNPLVTYCGRLAGDRVLGLRLVTSTEPERVTCLRCLEGMAASVDAMLGDDVVHGAHFVEGERQVLCGLGLGSSTKISVVKARVECEACLERW